MRAIWSWWSRPMREGACDAWLGTRDFLHALAYSFARARPYFSSTLLVTDSLGADILVGEIGLPFDEVCLALDELSRFPAGYWNAGKLQAFMACPDPFIHIDNDVFLWRRLPEELLCAPLFGQNPEYFTDDSDWYLVRELEHAAEALGAIELPVEWTWCRRVFGSHLRSLNTGIFGGWRTDFIAYCAALSLRLLTGIEAAQGGERFPDPGRLSGTLEMALPAFAADYHQLLADSPFEGLVPACLFQSAEDAQTRAPELGYTHLLGAAKKVPRTMARLAARVAAEHPDLYDRCARFVERFGEIHRL